MSSDQTLALHQLDSLDSPVHQQLLAALDDLTLSLTSLVRDAEGNNKEDQETLKTQVWESIENHNYVLSGLQMFRAGLESECVNLEQKLGVLNKRKEDLLDQRDELIEKGHELNCRIGYNALERKLEETFTDTEKYTTLESAKCFRDEAEEEHRRTNDLIRIGNMRACQIDRDLYNEMEKITDLFENYEKDREHYVRELDLFCDVRRQRISAWLAAEGHTDAEREAGEEILDYLNLTEKRRHMEAQLIKSALRMYSFNASLAFDREDNQKLMEELTNVQYEVNCVSGLNVVVPRHAKARTDLTAETPDVSLGDECEGHREDATDHHHEPSGHGLHRCPRRSHLATDPVTDVTLTARLEAALRWEEKDGDDSLKCEHATSSMIEITDDLNTSSESAEAGRKVTVSVCGDHQHKDDVEEKDSVDSEMPGFDKTLLPEGAVRETDSFLQGMESHTLMSGTADRHHVGMVRKRKSSLTNFSHSEGGPVSSQLTAAADSQERLTRSQGHETVSRAGAVGNRSRELSGNEAASRSTMGPHKFREDHRTKSSGAIQPQKTREETSQDC